MLKIDRNGFIVLILGIIVGQHDLSNFLVFGGYGGNPGAVAADEKLGSGQLIEESHGLITGFELTAVFGMSDEPPTGGVSRTRNGSVNDFKGE